MDGMENLITAMSNEDLAGLKTKYSDNPSVTTLIDGILETRLRDEEQTQAKVKFEAGIAKMIGKLPMPSQVPDAHNIYIHPGEVDVEEGEAEPVDIVVTPAETDKDGNVITPAVTTTEMRVPTHKEERWIVEVNHATRVSTSAPGTPKASKRAITVFKRNGTQLEPKGNFTSASKACELFKLPIGGDSATRVLSREGYITEPYDGTEFTEVVVS